MFMKIEGTFDYSNEQGYAVELVDITGHDNFVMADINLGTSYFFPRSEIHAADLNALILADEGDEVEFRVDFDWLLNEDLVIEV